MTTSHGLHMVKVTDFNCLDEEDEPSWSTACSDGWSIERAGIIWWAYADDVKAMIELLPEHTPSQEPA